MKTTTITANGVVPLSIEATTRQEEVTVYVPAVIGTATITIGWIDFDGTFVGYLDGEMLAGTSKRFACGQGVEFSASIAGYSVDFKIGYAD